MTQPESTMSKSLKDWQVQHILKGREQARLQEFVTESEWRSALRRTQVTINHVQSASLLSNSPQYHVPEKE